MPRNPPEHTRWKKGQSGNVSGKPKQLLTKDKVKSIMGKFASMTKAELEAIEKNPKSTMMEIMVASIITQAIRTGDYSRLNFILDRSIGRVIDDNPTGEDAETISISPQNIAELCKAAREQS